MRKERQGLQGNEKGLQDVCKPFSKIIRGTGIEPGNTGIKGVL